MDLPFIKRIEPLNFGDAHNQPFQNGHTGRVFTVRKNAYADSCAYPESFVRGGPTFFPIFRTLTTFCFLVHEGKRGTKYHYLRAIGGPPAKLHLNGVSLACR